MKELQPEIKKIKKQTKGNRTKESQLLMELYKEKGINPFATFPTLIFQLIVLIGLYSGLRKVISNPHELVTFAYPALQHLSWMKQLSHNIHLFDETLFGIVNLSRSAINKGHSSGIYVPALVIVAGSAIAQYYQSKQLLPQDKEQKSLRQILKSAGSGEQADQSEVNAAVGQFTKFLLPVMIFLFTISIASALSLYWLTGGIVAYIQQSIVLRDDESEMEASGDKKSKKDVSKIPEAEIVESNTKKEKKPSSKGKKNKKRRK
jgi:YidC/Oxa1 family membrane protein insertase